MNQIFRNYQKSEEILSTFINSQQQKIAAILPNIQKAIADTQTSVQNTYKKTKIHIYNCCQATKDKIIKKWQDILRWVQNLGTYLKAVLTCPLALKVSVMTNPNRFLWPKKIDSLDWLLNKIEENFQSLKPLINSESILIEHYVQKIIGTIQQFLKDVNTRVQSLDQKNMVLLKEEEKTVRYIEAILLCIKYYQSLKTIIVKNNNPKLLDLIKEAQSIIEQFPEKKEPSTKEDIKCLSKKEIDYLFFRQQITGKSLFSNIEVLNTINDPNFDPFKVSLQNITFYLHSQNFQYQEIQEKESCNLQKYQEKFQKLKNFSISMRTAETLNKDLVSLLCLIEKTFFTAKDRINQISEVIKLAIEKYNELSTEYVYSSVKNPKTTPYTVFNVELFLDDEDAKDLEEKITEEEDFSLELKKILDDLLTTIYKEIQTMNSSPLTSLSTTESFKDIESFEEMLREFTASCLKADKYDQFLVPLMEKFTSKNCAFLKIFILKQTASEYKKNGINYAKEGNFSTDSAENNKILAIKYFEESLKIINFLETIAPEEIIEGLSIDDFRNTIQKTYLKKLQENSEIFY